MGGRSHPFIPPHGQLFFRNSKYLHLYNLTQNIKQKINLLNQCVGVVRLMYTVGYDGNGDVPTSTYPLPGFAVRAYFYNENIMRCSSDMKKSYCLAFSLVVAFFKPLFLFRARRYVCVCACVCVRMPA